MKMLLKILANLIIIPLSLSAQWIDQTISTTNTLLDVQFVNQHVGFISDDGGKIYKTSNNGLEWTEYDTETNEFINSISFPNETNGWALGRNDGIIFYTNNSGSTWSTLTPVLEGYLNDIQMINNNVGWIAGYDGEIYKTTDGGLNWTKQTTNTTANLWSVYFFNENIGFAAGVDIILKTIDGGTTWTESFSPGSETNVESFKAIYFSDLNNGWAVGQEWGTSEGAIFHTTDAGLNWTKQNSGVTGFRLQSVHFLDNLIGYACGGEGTVLSTINGGTNWNLETTGKTNFLRDVFAIDEFNIYTVGVEGIILLNPHTLNVTTELRFNKRNYQVGSVQRITWESESIENISIEYSIDAGKNWIIIDDDYPAGDGYFDWTIPNNPSIYCKIKLSDLVNNSIYDIAPTILTESDGYCFTIYNSNQWVNVTTPTVHDLTDIKFLDQYNGIAWGNNVLLETSDGGANWNIRSEFTSDEATFVDKNYGWIIRNETDSIYVFRTQNGGITWSRIKVLHRQGISSEEYYFGGISFFDRNNGILSYVLNGSSSYGLTGLLTKTTDGGQTWDNADFSSNTTIENWNGSEMTKIEYLDINTLWYNDWHYSYDSGPAYDRIKYLTDFEDGSAPHTDWWHSQSAWFLANDQGGWYCEIFNLGNEFASKLFRLDQFTGNWDQLYDARLKGAKKIYFYDESKGLFWGNQCETEDDQVVSTIYDVINMTSDGGNTWELQQLNLDENLGDINSFYSLDGESFWAAGENGTLLRIGDLPEVPEKVYAYINVFLQGAYSGDQNMSSNLSEVLPLVQPFENEPFNYGGYERVTTIPNDAVDWIFVELRDKDDKNLVKAKRAALLLENGKIVDVDGISPVSFQIEADSYFICLKQRNHLSVMSSSPVTFSSSE